MTIGHLVLELALCGKVSVSRQTPDARGHWDSTQLADREAEVEGIELEICCSDDTQYTEYEGCELQLNRYHLPLVGSDTDHISADMTVRLERQEMVAIRDFLTLLLSDPLAMEGT